MSSSRLIHPEWYTSRKIASISIEAEVTYLRLMLFVDDAGRERGDPKYLLGHIYPYSEAFDEHRLEVALKELHQSGLIVWKEVEGEMYLEVVGFQKYQKVRWFRPSKFPQLTSAVARTGPTRVKTYALKQKSALVCDTVSPEVEVEVEVEVEKRTHTPSAPDPILGEFTIWWSTYPRKVAKPVALRAFRNARKKHSSEQITSGTNQWIEAWEGKDLNFVKHPSTYLNAEQYLDEPPPPVAAPKSAAELRHDVERAKMRAIIYEGEEL